ncbi:hypothetical protein Tco_1084424, partial [Tanacetum coccineum]
KRSTAKDAGETPNKHLDLKTDENPVDKGDQVFLDELERLKRQEQKKLRICCYKQELLKLAIHNQQESMENRAAVRAKIEVLRTQKDRAAVRAKIEVLRALEARITVLKTRARRHEWQRQDADDRATRHIMRIQALEAGARDDTLEDTASRRYRSFVLISYQKMAPKRATRSTPVTTTLAPTATATTSVTNAQLQAMIDQGVTAALAARDANRNGDDSHTS